MRTGGLRNLCTFLLFENENGGDCFINPTNLKRKYFVIGSKEAQHWEIKSALFLASTQQNTAEQEQQIWAMATLNTATAPAPNMQAMFDNNKLSASVGQEL